MFLMHFVCVCVCVCVLLFKKKCYGEESRWGGIEAVVGEVQKYEQVFNYYEYHYIYIFKRYPLMLNGGKHPVLNEAIVLNKLLSVQKNI